MVSSGIVPPWMMVSLPVLSSLVTNAGPLASHLVSDAITTQHKTSDNFARKFKQNAGPLVLLKLWTCHSQVKKLRRSLALDGAAIRVLN